MTQTEDKLGYVDTMRGIAILMVIVVHQQHVVGMSPTLAGLTLYGQMGVQLFFVASAYTLCISHRRREGEPFPAASFYIRRYFRIAPLYYLAIPLYAFVQFARAYLTANYAPASLNLQAVDGTSVYTFSNILANVLFVHGFVPAANNVIVPGGWSIGTEMAFYLIFPVLFFLLTQLNKRGAIFVLALLAGVFAVNCGVNYVLVRDFGLPVHDNTFIYFNLFNQLPVFLCGALAFFTFYLRNAATTPLTVARDALAFAAFTALSAILWRSDYEAVFPIIATSSGLSFLFLLNLLRGCAVRFAALEKIGQVSYSMYVFHFLFVDLAARVPLKLIGPNPAYPNLIYLAMLACSVALTYTVASLSKRWIEDPGIEFGRRIIMKLRMQRAAA